MPIKKTVKKPVKKTVRKTTRKKAEPKVLPKPEPETRNMASDPILALESLASHPGWLILKETMSEAIFAQEKKILNTLFNKDLKYNEEDLEKEIRRVYIKIRDFPEVEIARLTGDEVADDEYDPYYKNVADLK